MGSERDLTTVRHPGIVAASLLTALAITTAQAQPLPTTGVLHSQRGKLEFKEGYPTDATVKKLYDDIDFQRASQAYLWALPLMAMRQWQIEQREKFGAGNLDYVDYFTFTDKLGLLTANATTPYVMSFPNLKESGPLVMEVPPGATAGGVGCGAARLRRRHPTTTDNSGDRSTGEF
jgi:hypothetical protein